MFPPPRVDTSNRKIKGICEKYFAKEDPSHSANQPTADEIYQKMVLMQKGLNMKANPKNFTNKIVPAPEPLVKFRQNARNELEFVSPLPIAKINIISPSLTDEIRNVLTTMTDRMPHNDVAFQKKNIINACDKVPQEFAPNVEDKATKESPFIVKIIPADLIPNNHFAVNPMQVGKWFPGMFTIYPDDDGS